MCLVGCSAPLHAPAHTNKQANTGLHMHSRTHKHMHEFTLRESRCILLRSIHSLLDIDIYLSAYVTPHSLQEKQIFLYTVNIINKILRCLANVVYPKCFFFCCSTTKRAFVQTFFLCRLHRKVSYVLDIAPLS